MKVEKVFCIIDPTTNNQPALARSAEVARSARATLHAYICIPGIQNVAAEDRNAMREAEISRHEAWLDRMVEPHRSNDLTITTEVECDDEWRKAFAPAAKRAKADLIIKPSYKRSTLQRQLLKTSDWTLLRSAECPVMFVKAARAEPMNTILAALNMNAEDDNHKKLNDTIIKYSQAIAKNTKSELHAVNAYDGSDNFIHPPDLARKVGIPRDHAHVGDSDPETLVAEVAEKLGSPLVIIGSVARKGVTATVVGNTAERILDRINSEVMVVIQPRS